MAGIFLGFQAQATGLWPESAHGLMTSQREGQGDFPGGPMVKTSPSSPGGPMVKNLPAKAGENMGPIPGPGRSHMPQGN